MSVDKKKKQNNSRRQYNPSEKAILLSEVNRMCPLCGEKLIIKKKNKIINSYEIAHIYPHSPSEYELRLLKNEERLTEDADDIGNLIMLCPTCHRRHDKSTTLEEYRYLVKLKKKMTTETKCKDLYGAYTIDKEINDVIESLAEVCKKSPMGLARLETSALRVSEKSDETLDILTKMTIENYIQIFFLQIKQKFNELENDDEGIFDVIAIQVKSFYLKLKKTEKNKTILFEQVSQWIFQRTGMKNKVASEIIASFFVQNCEVLS